MESVEIIDLYWDCAVASCGGSPLQAFEKLSSRERIFLFEVVSGLEKMSVDTIMSLHDEYDRINNISSVSKPILKKFISLMAVERSINKEHSVVKKVKFPITVIDAFKLLFSKKRGIILDITVKYNIEKNEHYIQLKECK